MAAFKAELIKVWNVPGAVPGWGVGNTGVSKGVAVKGGTILLAGDIVAIEDVVLHFAASSTNYIEIDLGHEGGPVIDSNTSNYSNTNYPIAKATVDAAGNITLEEAGVELFLSFSLA